MSPSSGDPHNWHDLENYLAVHDKCMDGFSSFIVHDNLEFQFPASSLMTITGSIICLGGLVNYVEKTMAIDDRSRVRGQRYRYQVQSTEPPLRQIFRYGNSYSYPDHSDSFHRHAFNIQTWKPIFPPDHIGRHNFPTLSGVINELQEWWFSHKEDPDIFPTNENIGG